MRLFTTVFSRFGDLVFKASVKLSYLHRLDPDLGVVLLRLELQLHVEQSDLGVLVALGLHLEAGVGERLLEGHAGDQLGVLTHPDLKDRLDYSLLRPRRLFLRGLRRETHLQGSSLDLLDADHLERQQLVQGHDGVHHHLGEEVLLAGDELGVEGGGGALLQQLPLLPEGREREQGEDG